MQAHARGPDRRREPPTRTPAERGSDREVDDGAADVAAIATLEPAPLSEPETSRIRRGGLPDELRGGLESLSGFDLGDVRVHRDSARPAELGAAAYTQGADIHLGPGQDEHLPHEAWHVVQQRQGRVAPTTRLRGADVADDAGLEHEADSMGARALNAPAPTTAPRQHATAGSAAVQLKWGQYDGKERDRVRGVLEAAGRIEPFPYELAGVLEDLVHTHAAAVDADLQTAVEHLADHLTSLPRARAVTDAVGTGTAEDFIDVGCRACADDTKLPALLTCLDTLAQVVPQVPDVAVVTVAAALLDQGRTAPQVVDVLATTPTLMTTAARASAVVDHRLQHGTPADAVLAASAVGDDDAALVTALTAVRKLGTEPGFAALDDRDKKALVTERDHLTTDLLRTNAVALAQQCQPGETAGTLTRTRAFGYREDVETHVGTQADEHARTVVEQEKQQVTTGATAARVKAVTDQLVPATAALSNAHTKGLKTSEGTTKHKDAVAARGRLQKSLAEPRIAEVDVEEQQGLTRADTVTGPQAKQDKTQEYTTWLTSVGHHPKALDALKASGEDRDLAARLLTAITTDPRAQAVLIDGKLSPFVLGNLVTVPADVLGRLAAGGVTPATFGAYGVGAAHATLLVELGRALVPADRVTALVERFSIFQSHFSDPGEAARLADLLALTTVPEAYALRNACPTKVVQRMALLATLRPKALNAADLVTVLTFCKECDWDLTLLTNALGPLGNGLDLAALRAPVFRAELGRFDKLTVFTSWLECVDRLVGAQHLTIRARPGGWNRLNGEPLTDEQWYDVVPVAGGAAAARVADFVVHYHPDASGPTMARPNDSKSHLKPRPGGDVRCKSPDLLKKVRPLIKMQP